MLVREVLDVERLGQLEGVEDGLDLGLAGDGEAELAALVLVGKGGTVFVLQQSAELGRGLGVALYLEQPALQVVLDGVLAAQDGVGGEAVVGAVADAFAGEVAENLAAGGVGVRVVAGALDVDLLPGVAVGAQYAYWPDYGPDKALMWLRWHLLMPALTALLGYFPARRLGWHEDLPAGAAYEWAFRPATLEAAYRHLRRHGDDPLAHFAAMRGDLLAVSLSDDPFGTPAAIERLLGYYLNSRRHHLPLNPADVGVPGIGHFAWFHERFREKLWSLSLIWLLGKGKITNQNTIWIE